MESLFIFKEFFNKILISDNIESRTRNTYLNSEKRENYLFNSSINGIEDSDFIFLIGTNPRFEATILNSRIRKSYLKNKIKIISLSDVGDLTYPYESLDGKTENIKKIIEGSHPISDDLKNSKRPIVIFGQSALKSKSAEYLFESMKNYLSKINKISKEWNSINILSENFEKRWIFHP